MFYFGNGIDRKKLFIFAILVVLASLINMGTEFWIAKVLTLPGIIVAITFHEFAHAWVADRFGDRTPKAQGRLTLNPISHLDPFGFVVLLFAGVGWGRPVEINPNNFTNNKSRGTNEALVSIAGPAMNFILAILFTVLYYVIDKYAPNIQVISTINVLVLFTIYINVGLGVFNLIPLPPLDGEKIFKNFLPYSAVEWLNQNTYYLQLAFLILWCTGLLGRIVSPIIMFLSNLLLNGIGALFG